MMKSAGSVFRLYGNSTEKHLHPEMIAVGSVMLRYCALNAILLNEYLQVQDPSSKNPQVVALRQQLGTAFAHTDETMLSVLDAPDFFTPADKSVLISTLATTLAPLKVFYDPATRTRLRANFAQRRAAATSAQDQKNFDLAIHELDT